MIFTSIIRSIIRNGFIFYLLLVPFPLTITSTNADQLYTLHIITCRSHQIITFIISVVYFVGYGCATLFWFLKHKPGYLTQYSCAGTIADFVVSMLCNLSSPLMSDHNAAGWGYYDSVRKCWQTDR